MSPSIKYENHVWTTLPTPRSECCTCLLCCCCKLCLTFQRKKTKNTSMPAMFLAGSDKYLSALEGACLHLPLPLKGRPSLGHMFPLDPNKDVWAKTCGTLSFLLWCQILCIPPWLYTIPRGFWHRMRQINRELLYLLHKKQDLCQLLPSHCTSSAK